MPDLIQVADDLKSAPDAWLAQQMQAPTGSVPPWLVASEVQRREKLRSGAGKAQAPQSSVSQDLIKSLYARIPPTAGLTPPPTPPGMPRVNLSPGSNPSTLGATPGGTPPGNFKMPARTMADGGQYDDEEEADLYGLPQLSRRQQLEGLLAPPTAPAPPAAPVPPRAAMPAAPPPPAAVVPSGPIGNAARSMPEIPIPDLLQTAAQKYKLPPDLLAAVAQQESRGNPRVVSPKGAIGVMQIMPATAHGLGVADPRALFDPAVNIDTGARYLRQLLDQFKDPRLALAAYNAGPGAVQRHGGVPPYRETIGYTGKILDTVNGMRRQTGLQPLDASQLPADIRGRLVGQRDYQEPQAAAAAAPAAPPAQPAVTMPTMAPPALPMSAPTDTADAATAADTQPTGEAARDATITSAGAGKPTPLHQTWEQPTPEEIGALQKRIATMQADHQTMDARMKDLFGEDNLKMLGQGATLLIGPPQDYSKYSSAIQKVMDAAEKNMHPSIGGALMQFGLALMASPAHNVGQAIGEAGTFALDAYQKTKRQGAQDYLQAVKAGVDLQDKMDNYNAKMGQFKMQRLAAQQSGVVADERTYQTDLKSLQKQLEGAQTKFEKAITTPAVQNLKAVAILNENGVALDPKLEPAKQVVRDLPQFTDQVLGAGKAGTRAADKGPTTTEKTQEIRAKGILGELHEEPDPQYPTAVAQLTATHPERLREITVAPGRPMSEEDKNQVQSIVDGIEDGTQSPILTGMFRLSGPVRAEAAKRHLPLAAMQLDWQGIQRHLATLNGPQQERLRQGITTFRQSIPLVKELYADWKATGLPGGFKQFNRAALTAATNMPGEAGAKAQALMSQINDMSAELGQVFNGGYANTDSSLKKGAENLRADWNEQTFEAALKMIEENMKIRYNSVMTSQPVSVRPNSPYMQGRMGEQQPPATTQGTQTGGAGGAAAAPARPKQMPSQAVLDKIPANGQPVVFRNNQRWQRDTNGTLHYLGGGE